MIDLSLALRTSVSAILLALLWAMPKGFRFQSVAVNRKQSLLYFLARTAHSAAFCLSLGHAAET